MSDKSNEPAHFGSEPPIIALATVVQQRSEFVYQLSLPNGKLTHGHVPRRLMTKLLPLFPGDTLRVEITPYDFDRARITAKVTTDGDAFESPFV